MKLGLYARVLTHEQQTLALQREAMTAYAQQRHGSIVLTVEEVGTGVSERRQRDILMRPPRRLAPSAFLLARGTRLAADIMG
jgi:putative DNA-invertase from lambdoid prophage Rac